MDPIIAFLMKHWILSSVFVVLLVAFLINEWRGRAFGISGINSQELVGLMSHSHAVVVDLRASSAYEKGHILGAMNIPQNELKDRLRELNSHKSKPIVLICQMGMDSPKSYTLLKKEGFTQLYYLAGGMSLWQSNGMPIVNK